MGGILVRTYRARAATWEAACNFLYPTIFRLRKCWLRNGNQNSTDQVSLISALLERSGQMLEGALMPGAVGGTPPPAAVVAIMRAGVSATATGIVPTTRIRNGWRI